MRILFVMRSTVYVRNFESTLRVLAERGHDVHVVADTHEKLDPGNLVGRLSAQFPGITHSEPPELPIDGWPLLGVELRRGLDYLRYLAADYAHAPKMRRRAEKTAPPFVTDALQRPGVNTVPGRRALAWLIRQADRALPRQAALDAYIRALRPDLVAVTPLVEPGSPQSDFLRSAKALGIPTALCVYSWDNLTNKGLVHEPLDLVTVWNDAMKREAVELHRVPADRVVVTGAAAYDHWFTWKPSTDRAGFCARVGLDAAQPYLLYVCSSRFIAPDEAPFVRQWIAGVRGRSDVLRTAGILIRPHPQNPESWRDADFSDLGNVTVWPRGGVNPADEASRAEYYDSIWHSAAVVGVNTSAQVESAIVGRGVYTWLAPEFRETQEGTLHFRHLAGGAGGAFLQAAPSLDVHAAQLEAALTRPGERLEASRRFVERFIRPHGIGEAAAPRLVAALEATATRRARSAERHRAARWIVSSLLRDWAAGLATAEEKGSQTKQRRRKKRDKAARGAAAMAALHDGAFEQYVRVRDALAPLRTEAAANGPLTPAERAAVAKLEGLWTATPEAVAGLRRCGEIVTGVRGADYDTAHGRMRELLSRDLRRLLAKGYPSLRVDEPPILGAFGVDGGGRLYNADTLRFFRIMTLLQDAALLNDFRRSRRSGRRTVWEIGGGWGGFAYQFKTLCPDATYLITGHPDQLLLSGTYLAALFPNACIRFFDPSNADAFWHDWERVDLAFAPEHVIATMRVPSVELTLDLMALERMTPARVDNHVHRAYTLGSRNFFSLGCAPDAGSDAAGHVEPAIERHYWRHPVSAPSFVRWRLGLRPDSSDTGDHRFLLGWRRLHA